MSSNPSLYRFINFIGGNILDATNVSLLQTELGKLGLQGLGQLYAQGTLLNAVFNIAGSVISFAAVNGSFHIFTLVNGQFEDLGASVAITGSQPVSGASNPLYLNWSLDRKTSSDDPTFIDGTTGEPTIEVGQLSMQVSWADTSGVALNPTTQFAKNTSPIILATFNMTGLPVTVSYINGVFPYAVGTTTQSGLVRLSANAAWASATTFLTAQNIIDSNGNIQSVTVPGLSAGVVPTWAIGLNATTVDGQITWTNLGPALVGEAVNVNDTTVTNSRNPRPKSVVDGSVADLISSGTNSSTLLAWTSVTVYSVGNQIIDSNGNVETVVSVLGTGTSGGSAPTWNPSLGGTTVDNPGANQITWVNGGPASTTKYDPATVGQGGIFTEHVIYTSLKQKLTTFLDSVNTNIQNTLLALTNHIGKPLGSSGTHPFPTAFQVGATPSSHVGLPLGLPTSHPAQVNSDHAGFTVLRNPIVTPSVSDTGYAVTDGTNTLASLNHTGDIFSAVSNAFNAQGGNGTGGTAAFTGVLGGIGRIAAVLAEHVNYKSHGNNNPHNLNAADIGSVDLATVNAIVAGVLASANAYTNSKTNISTRVVTTTGAATSVFVWNGLSPSSFLNINTANDTITYVIINIGGHFEVAFGLGTYSNGRQVALPESSGWNTNTWYGIAAQGWMSTLVNDTHVAFFKCYVDPTTRIVTAQAEIDRANRVSNGQASIVAVSYRNI